MKKTIIAGILLSTLSLTMALETMTVDTVVRGNGVTKVTYVRGGSVGGTLMKTYKGELTDAEIVRKGSLFADDYIEVSMGDIKMKGQTQVLATKRWEAMRDSSSAYHAELDKQVADEK